MVGETIYVVAFGKGDYSVISKDAAATARHGYLLEGDPVSASLRLSGGFFGSMACPAGNLPVAPKSRSEVVLAIGSGGVKELVRLGALPCPACTPLEDQLIRSLAGEAAEERYGTVAEFCDREKHPFDTAALNWETLLPLTGRLPSRLYLRAGMDGEDLLQLAERFRRLGAELKQGQPGWYNPAVPEGTDPFTPYQLPSIKGCD